MKVFAILTLCALLGASDANPKGQFGICVEECSLTTDGNPLHPALPNSGCPQGSVCKSNGCGHTCQLLADVASASDANPKGQFGICVEECSLTTDANPLHPALPNSGCPEGSVCKSNGCGHTCQLLADVASVLEASPKRQIGICVEECSLTAVANPILRALSIGGCPDGYVCQSNGCGHTCQPKTAAAPGKNCPGVLCAMFCENGFQLGADGCPICRCS